MWNVSNRVSSLSYSSQIAGWFSRKCNGIHPLGTYFAHKKTKTLSRGQLDSVAYILHGETTRGLPLTFQRDNTTEKGLGEDKTEMDHSKLRKQYISSKCQFVRNRRIECIRLRWWWLYRRKYVRTEGKGRGRQRRSLSRMESFSRAQRHRDNRGTREDRMTSPCWSIGFQ